MGMLLGRQFVLSGAVSSQTLNSVQFTHVYTRKLTGDAWRKTTITNSTCPACGSNTRAGGESQQETSHRPAAQKTPDYKQRQLNGRWRARLSFHAALFRLWAKNKHRVLSRSRTEASLVL